MPGKEPRSCPWGPQNKAVSRTIPSRLKKLSWSLILDVTGRKSPHATLLGCTLFLLWHSASCNVSFSRELGLDSGDIFVPVLGLESACLGSWSQEGAVVEVKLVPRGSLGQGKGGSLF